MNRNETLTTGQVSGLLGISKETLMRYVREFRVHFSETASQRTRGRRWTASDIDKLMVIKKLHQAQAGLENIDQALKAYSEDPQPQQLPPGIMDSFDILAAASAVLEEVQAERAKVQALSLNAVWNESQFRNFESWAGRRITSIGKQLDELNYKYNKLGGVFKNPYRRYPAAPQYRRLWSEFQSWLKRSVMDDVESIQDQPLEY